MLYSYKMLHDTGFAPNPFHGILTLANCKPQMRKLKKAGDYIAGFTSKGLCKDEVGHERLIFLMKITEKMTYAEYYNDPKFQCKIPSKETLISKTGDNIYKPVEGETDKFEIIENKNHTIENMEHDLSGGFVLASTEFYYFGKSAIDISHLNIKIPTVQTGHGVITEDVEPLLSFLKEKGYPMNVLIDRPHKWVDNTPFN
jgi:Nucleotide modification associated domain 2